MMTTLLTDMEISDLIGRVVRSSETGMAIQLTGREYDWLEEHPLPSGDPVVLPLVPKDEMAGAMVSMRMMEDN